VRVKFLFDDDTFSFETLRTTGFANYFGADLGEVLATAALITDGDQASWHREWKATAGRVADLGEQSLAGGVVGAFLGPSVVTRLASGSPPPSAATFPPRCWKTPSPSEGVSWPCTCRAWCDAPGRRDHRRRRAGRSGAARPTDRRRSVGRGGAAQADRPHYESAWIDPS
jgi:hypothetical protein